MSLLSLNSIGQIVFELESGNEKWMDRRMDKQTNDGILTILKGTYI